MKNNAQVENWIIVGEFFPKQFLNQVIQCDPFIPDR